MYLWWQADAVVWRWWMFWVAGLLRFPAHLRLAALCFFTLRCKRGAWKAARARAAILILHRRKSKIRRVKRERKELFLWKAKLSWLAEKRRCDSLRRKRSLLSTGRQSALRQRACKQINTTDPQHIFWACKNFVSSERIFCGVNNRVLLDRNSSNNATQIPTDGIHLVF